MKLHNDMGKSGEEMSDEKTGLPASKAVYLIKVFPVGGHWLEHQRQRISTSKNELVLKYCTNTLNLVFCYLDVTLPWWGGGFLDFRFK